MLLVKHKQENLLNQINCYHSKCLPVQNIEKQYNLFKSSTVQIYRNI